VTQSERFKSARKWREVNRRVVTLGLGMKLLGIPEDHPARAGLLDVLRAVNVEQARLGDMAPAAPERVAGVLTRGERPMNPAT